MKKRRLAVLVGAVAVLCVAVFVVAAVTGMFAERDTAVESGIFVGRVEGLGESFKLGVDISSVIALEHSGVVFRDWDGTEADLFGLFAAGGANYVRVRVWNDPWLTDNDGTRRGFGGGNNDVERAIEIGRRATAAGLRLLVNFHYSDFWADPSKQMAPRAWEGMDVQEKASALYDFTYDAVSRMLEAGIDIGMVQIGNETNNGIAGVTGWGNKVRLFEAGSRAVINAERNFRLAQGREVFDREILIAVHKTDPENRGLFIHAAQALANAGVVYDVFGISYYNFWHGSLENLLDLMNIISRNFDVDVAIFETSYPFTDIDTDGHGNSWSGYGEVLRYPISVQGQAHAIRDVAAAVARVENGRGVGLFLWEPAWITVGPADAEANTPLWQAHGSGWATSYAAVYDPYDAGRYWGGSSWDNQAFFDHHGNPLPTLNLFNYLRTGAVSRYGNRMDMIQLTESQTYFFNELTAAYLLENVLPKTVPAIFANNDIMPINATWRESDLQAAIELFRAQGGITLSHIVGSVTHGGNTLPALHVLTIMPAGNLVQNHGFEEPNMEMWRVSFRGDAGGYANRGSENVHAGNFGFRWWRAANQPINFAIEQDFIGLSPGTYGFGVFLTGGNAGSGYEIYVYVLINGVETARVHSYLPGWNNWNNPTIADIRVEAGDVVTIGASLFFPNTNGAWGTLDDFFFFLAE